MIGMSRVLASLLSAITSSRPDFFGIMMSLTTKSGWSRVATSMPSCPSRATSTANPSISKFTSSNFRITGSSSTTRTVLSGTRPMLLRRPCAEDLCSEPRFEAEGLVEPDGPDVLRGDVEQWRFPTIADAADHRAHERGPETSSSCLLVGADGADLDVAGCVHARPGHRDQRAVVVAHSEVVTQLVR